MDVPAAPGDEVRTFVVDGARFSCRILWNDENPQTVPVLYIHDVFARTYSRGLGGSIGDAATVVLLSLPGSGDADEVPPDAAPDFFLRALLEVVNEVPLPRVNLVGGSATGPLAYQFARRHPQRVRRLVLVAAVASARDLHRLHQGSVPEAWSTGGEDDLTQDDVSAILRLMVDSTPGSPVIGRDAVRDRLTAMFGSMTRAETTRLIRRWRALEALPTDPDGRYDGPVLVFTGEHDVLTPPAACREFAATFDQATFATIQRADHMAHLERVDEVADLILHFVTDQPLDDRPYLTSLERFSRSRAACAPSTRGLPRTTTQPLTTTAVKDPS
ncbi:alpha/beta fold hydrolase [Actinokineospora pegani]|uniref:alpha/beta fold hydrolase n=1 Tax=Actinokineospora pegani TaxID=2654637 RepID=UPI0012EAAFFE|nr:alpha/beta fold hydrolase [Actinokineospora pegani]